MPSRLWVPTAAVSVYSNCKDGLSSWDSQKEEPFRVSPHLHVKTHAGWRSCPHLLQCGSHPHTGILSLPIQLREQHATLQGDLLRLRKSHLVPSALWSESPSIKAVESWDLKLIQAEKTTRGLRGIGKVTKLLWVSWRTENLPSWHKVHFQYMLTY